MIAFIERVLSRKRKDSINNRHMLFCDNCYWCLSYLPDLENGNIQYFNICPNCGGKIKLMYLSEKLLESDTNSINNKNNESEFLTV